MPLLYDCSVKARYKKMSMLKRTKIFLFHIIMSLTELIRYDLRPIMLPFSVLLYLKLKLLLVQRQYVRYADLLCGLFSSGWLGSYSCVLSEIKSIEMSCNDHIGERSQLIDGYLKNIVPEKSMSKYIEDPSKLFESIAIILLESNEKHKGIIILKYSLYFPLFFKLFDIKAVSNNYHIVLEPSWSGFADMGIMLYTTLSAPVFVMTYERRDQCFIEDLRSNLVPIPIGPSWWVDHQVFYPLKSVYKIYDIVMIGAWYPYKRHHKFFAAISKLKRAGYPIKVAVAGYSNNDELQNIIELSQYYRIMDLITFYDKIQPSQVSLLLNESRINILWSRFEGNNRAIVEGMFCDIPCILRKGHNYGEHYFYINGKTGQFSSERELPKTILNILNNKNGFSPRKFALENMSYEKATKLMIETISESSEGYSREIMNTVAFKVNELDGMRYLKDEDRIRFSKDYKELESMVCHFE